VSVIAQFILDVLNWKSLVTRDQPESVADVRRIQTVQAIQAITGIRSVSLLEIVRSSTVYRTAQKMRRFVEQIAHVILEGTAYL